MIVMLMWSSGSARKCRRPSTGCGCPTCSCYPQSNPPPKAPVVPIPPPPPYVAASQQIPKDPFGPPIAGFSTILPAPTNYMVLAAEQSLSQAEPSNFDLQYHQPPAVPPQAPPPPSPVQPIFAPSYVPVQPEIKPSEPIVPMGPSGYDVGIRSGVQQMPMPDPLPMAKSADEPPSSNEIIPPYESHRGITNSGYSSVKGEQIEVQSSQVTKESNIPAAMNNQKPMFITYYNQECSGVMVHSSTGKSIFSATDECLRIDCKAINTQPQTNGSYTFVYLTTVRERVNSKGNFCVSLHNVPMHSNGLSLPSRPSESYGRYRIFNF
ncbi:hypothetical protein Q1695_008769 [Nippostrongylus brasiliensis]|nr:hypothetical protein Q1695_008769 [Nippostrongylus brasiliensis]